MNTEDGLGNCMSKKYPIIIENEDGWSDVLFPEMNGYRMACCDCGLIHDFKFYIYETTRETDSGFRIIDKIKKKTYKVAFQARRNMRATAAHRRGKRD